MIGAQARPSSRVADDSQRCETVRRADTIARWWTQTDRISTAPSRGSTPFGTRRRRADAFSGVLARPVLALDLLRQA
jgi:hypothetical protein